MRPLLLAALALSALRADTYPRQPGIDVQHYIFRVTLADDTDEIAGETTVSVHAKEGDRDVALQHRRGAIRGAALRARGRRPARDVGLPPGPRARYCYVRGRGAARGRVLRQPHRTVPLSEARARPGGRDGRRHGARQRD